MKSYSLLTDDSNYEENFNFDYDKYIKQIDALFESKVYKEFQMYEFREGLINFYVESSKYISENIMHLPKDSLLLYLTEEEEKKETKSEDKGIAKFFKDAGAWLENAWKTICEAFKRIFNIDKATDKAKSLEEKAKKYDELKKSKEELEAKLKTLESSINTDSEVSGVDAPTQQPPPPSAPAPVKPVAGPQNQGQNAAPAKPTASAVGTPPSAAPASATPAAPIQPLTAKQKSLNIIAQYSNWAKIMYDRCNTLEQNNSGISISEEIDKKIIELKNKCSEAVDEFLGSNLYKAIEENISIKNNFNVILNIINLNKSKEINLANSSQDIRINELLSNFGNRYMDAKKLVRNEKGEYGDSTINTLVENELRNANNKNQLDKYAKVYGKKYKPIIKYLLIMTSIYIVIYFSYILLVENASITKYHNAKKLISASITYINLLYANLVLNTNFITKYNNIITLTNRCIDTTYMRFSQITIMELAVSYVLIGRYINNRETKDLLNKFFNSTDGTISQIHKLIENASFPPNNPISVSILKDYISDKYANGNGLINGDLEKALSEKIEKINKLWADISALPNINYNSPIDSVADWCNNAWGRVTGIVGDLGRSIGGVLGFK